MAVPLVSPDPTTVTLRTRYDSGHLILEFKYRGVKCSEETALNDTPLNRKRVQAFADRLERDLELGTFDYALYFPASPRAKKFSAPPAPSAPSALLKPLEPAFPRDAQPWKADELAQVVAVIHDSAALAALATELGRTERSLRERYQRLLTEANSPPRPNTRTLAPRWTDLELDWMRSHYASATSEEIATRFPYRRLLAVRCRASEMGLTLSRRDAALLGRDRASGVLASSSSDVPPAVAESASEVHSSPDTVAPTSDPVAIEVDIPSCVNVAPDMSGSENLPCPPVVDAHPQLSPPASKPLPLPPLPSYPDFLGVEGWQCAELVQLLHLLSIRVPPRNIAKAFQRPLRDVRVAALHLGISTRKPPYLSEQNEIRLVDMFQRNGLAACATHFKSLTPKELRTRLLVAGAIPSRSIAWYPHEVSYLRHSMKADRNVTEVACNLLISRDLVHAAAESVLKGTVPPSTRSARPTITAASDPASSARPPFSVD